MHPPPTFAAQRILVVGLGVEGVALARYFAGRGARVTVNDTRPAEALAGRLAELAGVPYAPAFGGHEPALAAGADRVYVSQGVPLALPLLAEARRRGVPVGSAATLLYEICRGRIAGITGSAGKTTTTALVGAIMREAGLASLTVGNIGSWPLAQIEAVGPDEWVVAEVSHTQLQLTTASPHVACVTNVTPNHLDQFSWDEYVDLKRNHVRHQSADDVAVLNLDEPVGAAFRTDTPAEALGFTLGASLPGDGTFVRDGTVFWRRHGRETAVLPVGEITLPGRHNLANVLAATATAGACGVPMDAVARAVRAFRGVPHRLERVATAGGVAWINDSIATAPERTLAGMRAIDAPLVLLLGGRDKNLPLDELGDEAARRCRAVIGFGEAGDLFLGAVRARAGADGPAIERVAAVGDAVEAAARLARPGDVVLFAPAGTSFDAYPNFERRGEEFRRLVLALAGGNPTPGPSPSAMERGASSGQRRQPKPIHRPTAMHPGTTPREAPLSIADGEGPGVGFQEGARRC